VTQAWQTAGLDKKQQLLDDVARALSHATDFETALRTAAECVVPRFADLVGLVMRRFGANESLTVIGPDPVNAGKIETRLHSLLPRLRRLGGKDTQRGREFRWIPHVSAGSLSWLRGEPELQKVIHDLDVHSLVAVPLRAGDGILGAMAFARTGRPDNPFHAADLAACQLIARRIAIALHAADLRGRALDEQSRRGRLEVALQKWMQVFERAGWGAAIVDGQDHRIEAVNPAFAQLHGYPNPESLIGRPFTDLVVPEHRKELEGWDNPANPLAYESLHQRADGDMLPVLTNVTPLPPAEGPASYVVTIQDLTELKRAEERLRRAQHLESVGRLAGGVAHEVNNMMTIILGFTDLLSRSVEFPANRQREMDEIRKAATRAAKTTQQLLAFSRQQILQPTDVPINEVIAEVAPVLRLLLPANVLLETVPSPLGTVARVDRGQLEQVLINLAFNARDAMPGGGTLRLMSDSRWLNEADGQRLIGIPISPGPYATVSVVDDGHGMDAATLTQVFQPFFTTKPVGSGTGLGLATVYGIVKQSGGYVWVESSPGRGTTVTICLPQVDEPVSLMSPPSTSEPQFPRCRSVGLVPYS
jgi:PAS domain S-box-containing protein